MDGQTKSHSQSQYRASIASRGQKERIQLQAAGIQNINQINHNANVIKIHNKLSNMSQNILSMIQNNKFSRTTKSKLRKLEVRHWCIKLTLAKYITRKIDYHLG